MYTPRTRKYHLGLLFFAYKRFYCTSLVLDDYAVLRLPSTRIRDFDLFDPDEPASEDRRNRVRRDLRRHTFDLHRLPGHSWWKEVKCELGRFLLCAG